jgi:hypothetical protein
MMLQHFTLNKYHYDIIKDGFLRPSKKTKNNANHFELANWIYTRINTNINKIDKDWHVFLIDSKVLLHTDFILHTSWTSELDKCNQIIHGKKLNEKKLLTILENFREVAKYNFNIDRIIHKIPLSYSIYSNEILIKEDIDLHQYLLEYHGDDKETIEYLKEHYPNVKIHKKKTKDYF